MNIYIFNEILGTLIHRDSLPEGVSLGIKQIGPVYNNQPAPYLYVTDNAAGMQRLLFGRDEAGAQKLGLLMTAD